VILLERKTKDRVVWFVCIVILGTCPALMSECPPVVCKLSQPCFLGGHREGFPGRGAQGDQELRQVLRHPQVHDLQLDSPPPLPTPHGLPEAGKQETYLNV
jgi:hypothetical protein